MDTYNGKSLESTGGDDPQFLFLIQESFLTQHVLDPTRGENLLDIVLSSQKELVDNEKYMNHWVTVTKIKIMLTST